MRLKCCVGGGNATKEQLFAFPKNDQLRNLWMSFLVPINPFLICPSKEQLLRKRVCKRHFDQHQFDAEGKGLRFSYPCLLTDMEIAHGEPFLGTDAGPRQCYQCHNESACQPEPRLQAPCPAPGQHCATVAVAPGFTSTLACAASAPLPCTLTHSQQTVQFTCTCAGHRCNVPFTAQLRDKLVNFTSNINTFNNTSLDLTDFFLKSLGNVSFTKLYETITVKTKQGKPNNTQSLAHVTSTLKMNVVGQLNDINAPRAEALKHEATEPSDDEEDENEGSGSYEETRLRRPASAPAAPSSYLPANENTAPPLFTNFILLTTMLLVIL